MGNDIELGASPKVAEIQEQREITKQANAAPLPGSLRDAFAIVQDITVGPYKVRPFYDGDYDILVSLGNPLGELMASTMAQKESKSDYFPRGKPAWQICHLMTIPIKTARKEILDGVFDQKAQDIFEEHNLAALVEIHNAMMKQLAIYWSSTIGYESDETPPDGEIVKKKQ